MKNAKNVAKKAVAVLSSLTVAMSCGTAGMLNAYATSIPTASRAVTTDTSAHATKMNIYDANGKDISSNPIIYLDNSDVAEGNTDAEITVKVGNDSGICDDKIYCATEIVAVGQENIRIAATSSKKNELKLKISALGEADKDGKQKSLKPGTTHVSFTTASGEVYRTLTVVVYEPATDMKIFFQNKNTQLILDGNYGSLLTVANHKYQFYADPVAATSTDVAEWNVYEGKVDQNTKKKTGTTKAEISEDGLFTPKKNGVVTIEAKFKATETSARKISYIEEKKDGNKIEKVQSIPKYIQVIIAKENPAKAMKITNAPEAMEANETHQLKLNMTPTYTGNGYESGATDVVRWASSNPNVVTVDDKGLLKAVGKGDATITAYGENANVFTECQIRVMTKATSVKITPSPTSTRVGVGAQLIAKMEPATADDEIVWTSSDSRVAKVESTTTGKFGNSQTAVVTGVKKGQVIITAKAKNSGVEAKCTVTVNDKINSDSLKLTITDGEEINTVVHNSTINLFTNQDIVVDAALVAADGSTPDDNIKWKITGNENAYVTIPSQTSKNIRIHGVSEGVVTVKAYSEAKPNTIYQTFKVQVLRRCDSVNLLDGVTNKQCSSKSLNIGNSFSLKADMRISGNYPYDHSDSVKSWSSSDPDIITVNNAGTVKAVDNGTATITVTTASGKTASCKITGFTTSQVIMTGVIPSSDGMSLPTASIILNRDGVGSKNLNVQIKNESENNVANVDAIWSSSNEAVATVSNTGVVTAHAVGEAIITVKSGTKSDSCIVTVGTQMNTTNNDTISDVVYSPIITEYTPKPIVTFNGKTLVENVDYILEYKNNKKVGTATVTITGIGYYTGTKNVNFRIVAKPITDSDIVISTIEKQQCTGRPITPDITVTCAGVKMTQNTDYSISFSNNSRVGKATVTIRGTQNYTGNVVKEFEIYCNHTDVTRVKVVKQPSCDVEGIETVRCNACSNQFDRVIDRVAHTYKNTVVAPTNYTNGYTLHQCSVCGYSYKDNYVSALMRKDIANCNISINATSFPYTGGVRRPSITVKDGNKTLKLNTDYTVVYSNYYSKDIGTYSFIVFGKNTYGGGAIMTYDIVESAPPVKNVSTITSTNINLGQSFTINAKATGGTAPYTYYYFYKAPGSKTWSALSASLDATSRTTRPTVAGTYGYSVKIVDANGKFETKIFTVNVKSVLNNVSTISATNVKAGTNITINAKASGGNGPYKYYYYFKAPGSSRYVSLSASETATKRITKPPVAGTYYYSVKVVDAKGNSKIKIFTVNAR